MKVPKDVRTDAMPSDAIPIPLDVGEIAQRIQLIRGQRVILDTDLAAFYGETTKRFNQQVRRNLARFPADFMFQQILCSSLMPKKRNL